MKPAKKIILALVSLVLFTCSKEDEGKLITQTLELEEGIVINFEDLTALTFDEESNVDENGGFDIDSSTDEDLPIVFLKDDEIIFGYYDKTGSGNTVSVNDILLFYFSLHPEIIKQGIKKEALLGSIKSNGNYENLKNQIKTSLGENVTPFKNENFVKVLNESGYEIGVGARAGKKNKISTATDKYKVTFARNGTVQWEKQFPVYCTVGLEIVDKKSNESVSGSQVLDKAGLPFAPGPAIEFLYKYFTTEESDTKVSFELPGDGEYQINLSNGVDNFGTNEFESKIDEINRINLGIDIVSFMIPIGIDKVLGKADCRDAIVGFFKGISLSSLKTVFYLNGNLNKVEAEKELFNISNDIYDQIVQCALGGNSIKFIDKIKDIGDKYFNKVNDGASIVLFIRDYVVSNINSSETRYFYDGVSFGKLSYQNLSGLEFIDSNGNIEFKGGVGSEHIFKIQIKEEATTHNVERLLISTINTTTEDELGIGIPFSINKANEGDATVKEVKVLKETRLDGTITGETGIDGELDVTFKMGTADSQFEIKPAFEEKGLPKSEKINLKVTVDSLQIYKDASVGNWTTTWHMDTNGDGVLDNNDKTQIDKIVFYEGGTGKRLSKIDYYGNFTDYQDNWGTDPFYDIVWSITKKTDGYYLSFNDLRWTTVKNGGKITNYPNMECVQYHFGNMEHTITIKD